MASSSIIDKVRCLGAAWSSLLTHTFTLPFCPSTSRLRRTLLAGELLKSRLPLVRIETVIDLYLDDSSAVIFKALPARDHNCSVFELIVLGLLTKCIRPTLALEIGTYDGRSTLAIASNLPENGKIFTINLPPEYCESKPVSTLSYDERLASKVISGCRSKNHAESIRIHQLFGNSLNFDFTPYSPAQLVFVDGGHSEKIVEADTESAMRIVDREGGVILWHDATKYGVRPVLEKLAFRGQHVYLIAGTTIALLKYKNGEEMKFEY